LYQNTTKPLKINVLGGFSFFHPAKIFKENQIKGALFGALS